MNLRFSGIPEIQTLLAKSFHQTQASYYGVFYAEKTDEGGLKSHYSEVKEGHRGAMTAYLDAATMDPAFPEFLDQFEEHIQSPITFYSKAKHTSLQEFTHINRLAPKGNLDVESEDLGIRLNTQAFRRFAELLTTHAHDIHIANKEKGTGWYGGPVYWKDRIEGLLNALRPESVGKMRVELMDNTSKEVPILFEEKSKSIWSPVYKILDGERGWGGVTGLEASKPN